MFKRFFSLFTRQNSIGAASLILIITAALSRLMGLPRDYFLAQKIPSADISVYHASFLIPDFIVNILIIGAISAAFVPVFIEYLSSKKEKEAFDIANSILNIGILVTLIYGILTFLFAPYILKILVPGFSQERIESAVLITRILAINPIFFSLAYVFGGILNSYKRFLAYSLAPIFYNTGIILGTVFFADEYGILGPAIGAVAGAFLHFLIQFIPTLSLGYSYKWSLDIKNKGVREIGRLMLPRMIGLSASYISVVVLVAIASLFDPKDIALFNFANNIALFIPAVFGISFAIAVFPTLTEKSASGDSGEFVRIFSVIFRQILFYVLPLTALLLLFRAQVVRILLGSGFFLWENTIITAAILGAMTLNIFAQSLIPLLARSFYALKDTKTPVIISIVSVIITIISGYFLAVAIKMGVIGLGFGMSFGAILQLLLLIFFLRKKVGMIDEKTIFINFLKVSLATLFLIAITQSGKFIIEPFVDTHTRLGLMIQVCVVSLVGLGVYLLVARWLKLEQYHTLLKIFQRKGRVKELIKNV